jgi:hypothetical protein
MRWRGRTVVSVMVGGATEDGAHRRKLTAIHESRMTVALARRRLFPLAIGRRHAVGCSSSRSERTAVVWRTLEFDFGGTDTVLVKLTNGAQVIEVLTDVELVGRTAVLRGLHILGSGRNTLGPAALRELINWAKVQLDVEKLRIEGATRTSGAGPGRIPPALVF